MEKPTYIALTNYFKGQASPETVASIELWQKEHMKEFEELRAIWETHGSLADSYEPNLESAWEKIEKRTKDQSSINWFYRIAASLLLVVGAAWWLRTSDDVTTPRVYTTSDEKYEVALQDGSKVTLAPETQLEIASGFGEENRLTKLMGKAFFEVSPNERIPFEIDVDKVKIEVVGTSFQVTESLSTVQISVVEGEVLVKANNEELTITKCEHTEYNKEEETLKKSVLESGNQMAWKTGVLTFTESPLRDFAKDVGDYFGVKIEVSDALQDRKITSTFDNQPLSEILQVVSNSLDVKVDSIGTAHYRIN